MFITRVEHMIYVRDILGNVPQHPGVCHVFLGVGTLNMGTWCSQQCISMYHVC